MTRVVVVDHHDSYTQNLVHLVAAVTGDLPEVVEHDRVTPRQLAGFTHVVLSPGPGHPANPADFALGRGVFELGLPVLGVCLGMQALAHVYGARVVRFDPAHGEVSLIDHDGAGVFAGLPQGFAAVRYHSLAVDLAVDPAVETLTDALEVTATCSASGGRRVVMALRHRTLPLVGVQFHPESILSEHGERMIANFLGAR